MKKLLQCVILILFTTTSIANVAQPGMWSTGYASRFMPMFDEDTIHFGKIQMQKETVLINLYPGFAAVKGEYWMHNTTNKTVTMTVGYPVNGSYEEDKIGEVMYEDLFNLKVLVDGKAVTTFHNKDSLTPTYNYEKWYYWKTTFPPNATTKITVYFLTDNSRASLRKGYNTDEGNAFTYVLESGRAWAGNIGSGEILINLNDGLTLKDVKGILPPKSLKGDDKHLQLSFSNLEPMPASNILIWYKGKSGDEFDFKAVAEQAEKYYRDLDKFPVDFFNKPSFKTVDKSDFKVKDTASIIFWGIIIFICLLFLALIFGLVYIINRLVKRSKRKGKSKTEIPKNVSA